MIFLTFLCQLVTNNASQIIDKTIYLIQGEEYKVNLDSIFKEEKENTYSFQSDNKGFTLDTSSLKLKSDQGTYSIKPTKILRERQLIDLEDYQGLGQFGILDQHDSGHRICYNSDAIITIDQCIVLDNTATSYDFVFIDRNTIAVSKVRVADQQFGVTIYQDKEIVSELYFVPSKTYTQIHKTIIEYFIYEEKKYFLFGVTEEDSKIEFLEIQDNLQIVYVMDKSQLPNNLDVSHVLDIKGGQNKVFLECKSSLTILKFQNQKIQHNYIISQKKGSFLELGYSYLKQSVNETYFMYYQDQYTISSNHGSFISDYFGIKHDAQVKYTLNYLIVLQDNVILVTTLYKSAQRTNIIEGMILKIDVDFQNDILIVFTDSKIMTYYLKQATLSYSSHKITKNLDLVTIQAGEQLANIRFQVLSKDDYNLYSLQDLSQDLYYNLQSTQFNIPLNSISGGDIKVEAKVDDYVKISNLLTKHRLQTFEKFKEPVILEQLSCTNYGTYLFRQFEDFSYKLYECQLNILSDYKCYTSLIQNPSQNQTVIFQTTQVQQEKVSFALLNSDGLEINIFRDNEKKLISLANQTLEMKVGIYRLFLYTICDIQFYHFPSGEFIYQFDLSQFGQPKGEFIRKLWVNEAKTNLMIITYGEDLIVGRFTTRFIFIQRITIQQVIDVCIINDDKFIVLSTDKTTKSLTQYILEEGTIRIQKEMDTHGYIITGDKILSDFVQEAIIIQAQKYQQKALLVFGNTELARDSLLKVINLQDDELVENVVQNGNKSSLLIRATDPKKNSTIIDLNYTHYGIDCNLTKIPTKFNQQLDLKYIYKSQFSQNKIETKKYFFLEYQFQNITIKQSNVAITYQNQLKIPINTDVFQGHVEKLYLKPQNSDMEFYKPENSDIELITRFKNNKPFISFDDFNECQQVISFQRIICLGSLKITYLSIDGMTLSSIKLDSIKKTGYFKQMVLRDDGQYALIRTEQKMILVHISQNEIQLFQTFYDEIIMLDIFIFHKDWLIVYNNQLNYFKFIIGNDSWQIEKQKEYQIFGIQAIQYDPITEQLFYINGDQNLHYFRFSLEGDTIDEYDYYSINLPRLLKSFNIHQVDARVQYIKIIQQFNKSYLLASTSYGQVWNISINSLSQDFKLNNMYIVGRSLKVYDIQIIDDYVLIQNILDQVLYKNLDRPNLGLESIFAQQIIGLFKKGSQIIHICGYSRGMQIDQNTIDDEVFLTIKNLSNTEVSICAANGYQQEVQVNYSLVFQNNVQSDNSQLIIIAVFGLIAIIYYVYKARKQRSQPLIAGQNNLEMVQQN